MPDDDSLRQLDLQENIFEPEINAAQRRLAVRYDALRAALGKTGRFYDRQIPLILPPPRLVLEPEAEWRKRFGRNRGPRRARLIFAQRIPHARLVSFDELGHAPQLQDPARFHQALLAGLAR